MVKGRYTRSRGGPVGGAPYYTMAREIQGIIEAALAVAGEDGEEEAVLMLESSGTHNEWSGEFTDRNGGVRSGSGEGRVDTGAMRDALGYRIIRGKRVGLDVGWTNPSLWQNYFAAQDQGFDASGYRHARQHVEGMHIIAHLQTYMHGKVDEQLAIAERIIVNGL